MSISWVGGIIDGIVSVFAGSQELRAIKNQGSIDIEKLKIESKMALLNSKIERSEDYDIEALRQQQYSWKDEWLLFVLTLPFIGSFIPGLQDHVDHGWDYVAKAPGWYVTCFIGVIAAVYGLRWFIGDTK